MQRIPSISDSGPARDAREHHGWTFLSNHAHVLVCLARDADARLRDVADLVGITERAVHRIITELEEAGVITRQREGRRNHYEINSSASLRHPMESDRTVGSLLSTLLEPAEARRLGLRPAVRRKSGT
ncbi:MAG: winged helix-turn-helix domain-containing protein [Nannocystaceae bacterium]